VHEEQEQLKLDYEQSLETYRQLAEIRFKLLAFAPTISGAAIALLTQTGIVHWEKVLLAPLGFLSLGIVPYSQHTS
jgi:1,4-dihydroxy-2-naphthoate octaprenyltransferase